jgi:hypothetical protein
VYRILLEKLSKLVTLDQSGSLEVKPDQKMTGNMEMPYAREEMLSKYCETDQKPKMENAFYE